MQIKNVKVYGLESNIVRSGYPMQVGEPDSFYDEKPWSETQDELLIDIYGTESGHKHLNRVKKLAKTPVGSGHNNFLKGIIVQFDLKYTQYWTKQLQRYHWFEFVSSQSLMHKITSVKNIENNCNGYVLWSVIDTLNELIECYNLDSYPVVLEDRLHKDNSEIQVIATDKYEMFQYIISNLPMGYELWAGISTNYLQLKTIYNQRKNHKLQEWKEFCQWIKTLPMANELIINEDTDNS